jgi:hypothetical protein
MDKQSRKYQLTINNPKMDFSHEKIKEIINNSFPSTVYFCMADEQGQTFHTHLYLLFSGGVRFSTIKRHFPTAHIEAARGSSLENREYIAKDGKHGDKTDTKIEGSFEEWGVMPAERHGGICIEAEIIERIQDGANNAEILIEFPHFFRALRDVEYVRQTLKNEEYREKWRDLEVTYIWGQTGTGKTRFVMEGCGYSNVYAVNTYKHPFDGYAGENVILFDEFNSSFRIQDMNNYLDGYPLSLPARYSNKQACYERVFIISNLPLREQYTLEKNTQMEIWMAFVRRIHNVIIFMPDGTRREQKTHDYISGIENWTELPGDTPTPWDGEEAEDGV